MKIIRADKDTNTTDVHGTSKHTEFANWKVFYSDGSGDQQELSLGAAGTILVSAGTAAAPTFPATTIFELDIATGQLKLPTQGSGAGILIGGEIQLYRSSANTLRIIGTVITQVNDSATQWNAHTFSDSDSSAFNILRSRGTEASPSDVLSGNELGRYAFGGRAASTNLVATYMRAVATENYSGSGIGTKYEIYTTPNSSLTPALAVAIDQDKKLLVDVITELTSAAGVTIDGVLLKDGVVTVGDVAFDDATSDPLIDGTVDDGNENSVARKDHVHPIVLDASTSVKGKVELATAAETTTGTSAVLAVTPDGLEGSQFGRKDFQYTIFAPATNHSTGTGLALIPIPDSLDGWDLVYAHSEAAVAGSVSGTMVVDIHLNGTTMMTTDKIDTPFGDEGSDAGTAPAFTTTAVAENDRITIDVDAVHGTVGQGLVVSLGFRKAP